jgi:5-formyltetrahydrofolate cyclo-ligase
MIARRERAARRPRFSARAGELVASRLASTAEFAAARAVALYAARASELPTRAAFAEAARQGKRTLFPRARIDGVLEFRRVRVWEDLRPGRYGVLEPTPEAPLEATAEMDLVLVPGLAFDSMGRRLGSGKGFYDRTFSAGHRGPLLFGMAFSFQLVDEVPSEPTDRRMDAVLTEEEIVRIDLRAEQDLG